MKQVTRIHSGGRKMPVLFFADLKKWEFNKLKPEQHGSHFARYCNVVYDLLQAENVTEQHRKFFQHRRGEIHWTHFIYTGPNVGILFRWTGAYVICGRFWACIEKRK